MVKCMVCGTALQVITGIHLRKHGLTTDAYRTQYNSSFADRRERLIPGLGTKPDSINRSGDWSR